MKQSLEVLYSALTKPRMLKRAADPQVMLKKEQASLCGKRQVKSHGRENPLPRQSVVSRASALDEEPARQVKSHHNGDAPPPQSVVTRASVLKKVPSSLHGRKQLKFHEDEAPSPPQGVVNHASALWEQPGSLHGRGQVQSRDPPHPHGVVTRASVSGKEPASLCGKRQVNSQSANLVEEESSLRGQMDGCYEESECC